MWQHVKLSEQIRPWDTLACCWDVKQPTNKQAHRQQNKHIGNKTKQNKNKDVTHDTRKAVTVTVSHTWPLTSTAWWDQSDYHLLSLWCLLLYTLIHRNTYSFRKRDMACNTSSVCLFLLYILCLLLYTLTQRATHSFRQRDMVCNTSSMCLFL